MKAIKSFFLFMFSMLVIGCFESPEFSDVPKIQFRKIYFGYAADPIKDLDSLVVELGFEDGDGDLGLGTEHQNYPFHDYDFYLGDGTTTTDIVRKFYSPEIPFGFLDVPEGATGKLVRFEDQPSKPDNCDNYATLEVLIHPSDLDIIDDTYNVVKDSTSAQSPFYRVTEKFLITPNKYYNNIFVKFYRNETPGNPNGFVEYKWPFCQDFNGRFVVLSDDDSPLSGTIKYTISSYGLATVMNVPNVTWKMSFTVVDRSRRGDSADTGGDNTVTTQEFTLDEITGR